jgi:CTP-dependent riboflavin kinase
MCFQCGLDTLLKQPFKSTFDLQVDSEHKRCLLLSSSNVTIVAEFGLVSFGNVTMLRFQIQ